MKYLSYKKSHQQHELFVENIAVSNIAKHVPTPFYCYSKQNILDNYFEFTAAFTKFKIKNYKICYAIKANYNLSLVSILAQLGCGIDAVSSGEIFRALKAGVNPKKIVFAGVGKTREDIFFALNNGVEEFSVESNDEIYLLNEIAISLGKKAKFSLRVNPDVDAKTHDKISTGRKGDKFGIDIERAEEIYHLAAKLPGLEIYGISMHIGSQINNLAPFEIAFSKMLDLYNNLTKIGFTIKNLDFGGGIGINYKDEKTINVDDYIKLINNLTKNINVAITIAPGRAIIGNTAILVTKTLFTKHSSQKNYAIIDAGINDLMRPGLYGSYHEILPVVKDFHNNTNYKDVYDFAGPVCESTDILGKDRKVTIPKINDLYVFLSAGAYGSSMANEYNCRPLVPEVLVTHDKFKIIRRRPSFDEMIHLENL